MSNQRPRCEFTDVDHAQKPSDYVHMLDVQRSMPFIQQYKQRARVLLGLHPGQQVLDAGAGTGEDAQTGRFFHAIMWFITIGRKPA